MPILAANGMDSDVSLCAAMEETVMGRRPPLLLALGCWLWLLGSLSAQVYNSSDHVRNLYRKYLDREPTSNELTQWVWSFQKGLSLSDAQATFLSSDDYYSRRGRNPNSFVSGLYAEILNRAPSANEASQWVRSLNANRGDRAKLVREFLQAAQQESSAATALPAGESSQRQGQLVATARVLRNSIEQELGGTHQGRQLAVMSRNLVNASRSLELAPQTPPATYQQALDDVQAAFGAVAGEMAQLHFSAPTSSTYLTQFEQILATLGSTASRPTPLPPANRPPSGGIEAQLYNQLVQTSTTLLADTNQAVYLLRNSAGQNSAQTQLLRDVEFFYSQATALHQTLQEGMPKHEVRHGVLRLRALSQGVSRTMQTTSQIGWVAQRWDIVSRDLQQLGELVGVSLGPTIDPGQPVLLNAPTYYQLPYQVQRPTTAQLSSQAIPLTDQAMAHVDALVVGFNRFLPLSPRVPALQAQARTLRMSLGQFRQELAGGSSAEQLKLQLSQINQSLQALNATWTRTVQERQLTNAPDLSDIAGSIQSLSQIFQGS